MDFKVNYKNIEHLANFLATKLPAQMRSVQAQTLSNLAYETREAYKNSLTRELTVRQPSLIRGATKYTRANLKSLQSAAGATGRDRFSGWVEQEGEMDHRNKGATLAARKNTWNKKIPKKYKLSKKRLESAKNKTEWSRIFRKAKKQTEKNKMYYFDRVSLKKGFFNGVFIYRKKWIRLYNPDQEQPENKKILEKTYLQQMNKLSMLFRKNLTKRLKDKNFI